MGILPMCSVALSGTIMELEIWEEIMWITKQKPSFYNSRVSSQWFFRIAYVYTASWQDQTSLSWLCLWALPIILHCLWVKEALILTARCLELWPSPFSLGSHFDKHHLCQFPWFSQLLTEARWTACCVQFSPPHWARFQLTLSISCHSSNQDMIYIFLKEWLSEGQLWAKFSDTSILT